MKETGEPLTGKPIPRVAIWWADTQGADALVESSVEKINPVLVNNSNLQN